ncbi:hypothetical protein LSTR_LSTR016033 [Laodelphax striatellus]|uniref:Uncharacterized protein n=1 Tax=Laodelphax striatellus TaxID=195883 RepID=A0A482XP77_LAOST|nr:hypothetical protein LSTR_LSTR016033 [Laodelphax striatellus]
MCSVFFSAGSSELSRGLSLQVSMMAQVLNQIMLKVESVLPPPPTPPPVANGLANRRRRRRRRKHRTSSGEESTDMSQGEEVEYLSDTDSDCQ